MKIYKYRATRVRKHHNKRKWFAPKIILTREKGVILPLDIESIEEEMKLWNYICLMNAKNAKSFGSLFMMNIDALTTA